MPCWKGCWCSSMIRSRCKFLVVTCVVVLALTFGLRFKTVVTLSRESRELHGFRPADRPDVRGPADGPDIRGPADGPHVRGPADGPEVRGPADRPDVRGPADRPDVGGREVNNNMAPQLIRSNNTVQTSVRVNPTGQRGSAGDDGNFQPIGSHQCWVYSAFYDTLNGIRFLRVMAIENNETNTPVFCQIWENGSSRLIGGKKILLPDHHFKRYRSVNYECTLDNNQHPDHVSIVFDSSEVPTNQLVVNYPAPQLHVFTTCYSVLFNFKNPSQIIQNIEFHRFLGIQHFHLYNYSVSNETDKVLRHYIREGILTVHQWSLPSLEIWYFAQVLAINDCVYRNRNVSKYVIIHDMDEFIVPIRHNTLSDVIAIAEENYKKESVTITKTTGNIVQPLGSLTFETSNFYGVLSSEVWDMVKKNFSVSAKDDYLIRRYQILPFLHVRRVNETYKYLGRSKTMVRPELILYAGIHYTREHRHDATHTQIGAELVLIHHFRYNGNTPVLDTSAMRFKDLVFPRILDKLSALIG
ncbi:beta-1,4-galactosyltransferase galt-1-like [Physella acuta]|uniref:beta-1,4-galactosyltransferase galt-1-like n=1 Tax=Physella acuta TaxID=109671 RepID=UPI0027DAEE04|nr:beta-1,4-galactosyltransferase galt-1-like [Physella acuta]